jgi:TatD DNase family protein
MYFDSHSHLQLVDQFPDYEDALNRAENADVKGQMVVGFNLAVSRDAVSFAKKYNDRNIWAAIGLHPHDAKDFNHSLLDIFQDLAQKNPVIKAIGEIGLDYFRNLSSKDIQVIAFKKQMELAMKLDLPVILHIRDAWNESLEILSDFNYKKVVLHSFTGSFKNAQDAWGRGYMLSFSGMITYPKNEYLREIVSCVPLEQILIETDCPYLPPQNFRGKRNEPAFVVDVAREIAQINKMSIEEIGDLTTNNAKSFFNLD